MSFELTQGGGGAQTHIDGDERSLCSIFAGGRVFGIDTRRIREVLGNPVVQAVPLAPRYLGGIVPYRGEILTAVDLRALLGLPQTSGPSCVLVLDDIHEDGRYGLMVDRVGGVVAVDQRTHALNPTTLDDLSRMIFDGVYRMPDGLLIHLDPARLSPSCLRRSLYGEARMDRDSWAFSFADRNGHPENYQAQETSCTH